MTEYSQENLLSEEDDLYSILGLPSYPAGKRCTASAIKKAYYRLVCGPFECRRK